MDQLTPKQRLFVAEYIIDLNATQAAKRAGYAPASAYQQAHALLKKIEIRDAIADAQKERSRRLRIDQDFVLQRLANLADIDLADACHPDGTLKNIHDMPKSVRQALVGVDVFEEFKGNGDERELVGSTKKVRFADRLKALELLGRHLKLFTDKIEHSGQVDIAARLAEGRRRLAKPEPGEDLV